MLCDPTNTITQEMELKTIYYKDLLKRFDVHILSTKSIKSGNHYTGHVQEFLCYLEEHKIWNLKKADTSIMKAYFNYLIERPKKRGTGKLSVSSVNDNLSSLRMFSIRMQQEDIISKGMPVPKNIKYERDSENDFALVREILTPDEVKEVFEHCQTNTEKALIALAYGCGLRRNALVNLKEFQIDFQKGLVAVEMSKNNKTRQVPISDFFLGVLRDYCLERLKILSRIGERKSNFFINDEGKPYSGDLLNKLLKVIIKRTGNLIIIDKRITLHCLRHSIATHLLDAGESFEYVKTFLGHSIADTTLIYARRRKQKSYYTI